MADVLAYTVAGILFGVPLVLIGLVIRHLIPLLRDSKAPWWAGVLGPFAYADRWVSEDARAHRTKCLVYAVAFVAWVGMVMVIFGGAK